MMVGIFKEFGVVARSAQVFVAYAKLEGASIPKSQDKSLYSWLGGYGVVETHDPIPNSNVKRYSADGTLPYGMGE
jgi:hypothetical protein